jgi:4-hydroxy-tetrahydrodipicolinate synthase
MDGMTTPEPPLWRGVAAALVTLFDDDLAVDVAGTAAHAVRLVDLGVRAVVVGGSTGESDSLTNSELGDLVAAVRDACPRDVPVLAGGGGPWTAPAVARSTAAVKAGADAVLVAPPRRAGDLRAYYGAVAEAVAPAYVLAYHYPGVAGGEVPVAALPELPIHGLKDSTGDAERLLAELAAWDRATYVGSSALTGYAGFLGAAGAILAVANVAPEDSVAAFDGDAAAQRRLLAAHLAVKQHFPHGLKAATAQRFGTPEHARLG